jgi:hypothetical protein
MTKKITFSKGKWEFYVIHTYLWSIFASNPNNPKEEGRDLPNTYFRGPKESQPKNRPYASSYIKIIMND